MVSEFGKKYGKPIACPVCPLGPLQVTSRENVGSLDAPRTAHLFTFGPRGRVMN